MNIAAPFAIHTELLLEFYQNGYSKFSFCAQFHYYIVSFSVRVNTNECAVCLLQAECIFQLNTGIL